MSADAVKNEVSAVRDLRGAVRRYAEHIRDADADSRREVAAADHEAREAVERRRSQLHRAEQELRQARSALAQCQENCGGLQRAVADAQERQAQAKRQFDNARRAAQLTSSAQSDLLKVLQTIDAVVGEHSSVASSALATLEIRLCQLPHFDLGAAVHNALLGTGVAAEIAVSAMGISKLAGNVSQGALPTADHVESISQVQDLQAEDGQQLWKEVELDNRKRGYADDGEVEA